MASSNTDHIHVGQDGWLFLKTGTNDVLGQYERPEETTELIWQWRSLWRPANGACAPWASCIATSSPRRS